MALRLELINVEPIIAELKTENYYLMYNLNKTGNRHKKYFKYRLF